MTDIFLFPSADVPTDVILRKTIPTVRLEYSFTIPIRYIRMTSVIDRNGERVGYKTAHIPYRPKRPIQPTILTDLAVNEPITDIYNYPSAENPMDIINRIAMPKALVICSTFYRIVRPRHHVTIKRNGLTIHEEKETRRPFPPYPYGN